MTPGSPAQGVIEFGRFTIRPEHRELLVDGRPVELGGRAFDVLMALIEARGSVLSKDALMTRVWAGRIVEENSLEAQISVLRKAFGTDRDLIRTLSGRGYEFTGQIRTAVPVAEVSPRPPLTNLPELLSELIGRDAEVSVVTKLAKAHRLVTLVGAGGIGKTRLSLEVARGLLPEFADGVRLAELAPLSDPELVPVTVAAALGLTLPPEAQSSEGVASALGAKQIVLVLDNCEHVIEAAARMAEALLRAAPRACVLATSRESLRVAGEFVYRVPSLEVPEQESQDVEVLLRTGAVKLFMKRAAGAQFSTERGVALIAAICRRLDGIPLAIELAAARAATLGVNELALRLDDRFKLLTSGQRTALPRQQTLRATIDWSYDLLLESERVVLRRLAVFVGSFTLESASSVVGGAGMTASDIVEGVMNLVLKSLVTVVTANATAQYRLLETTRAYALEKLTESGERVAISRRHAEYFRDLFETAASECETRSRSDWLAVYGSQLDNVRAALDWAFALPGDPRIGAALTVAAVPLWFHLSLVVECGARAEQALFSRTHEADQATYRDMQLHAALAAALLYTKGPVDEVNAAWVRVLEIAERLNDIDYRLRALWGLWIQRVNGGEYRAALELAHRFESVAAGKADPADALIGDRMIGLALHYLGDQTGARRHLERMLALYVAPAQHSDLVRFQSDQRVLAASMLAHILWLQGLPDQALRLAQRTVEEAERIDHVISLCNTLVHAACPIALFNGDLSTAEHFVETLVGHSANRTSARLYGRCYEGTLLVKRGDSAGLPRLSAALDELRQGKRVGLFFLAFLSDLAEGLGRAGRADEGLVVVDEALELSERNDERWCMAELLRVKGELLLTPGATGAAINAEALFRQGLESARGQGALSWELRNATSLARLWREQGRPGQARAVLEAVYGRFAEGFGTADLSAARALLDSLPNAS